MSKEFYRGEIFYIRNESEYNGNVQGETVRKLS